MRCPCDPATAYADCCGPLHAGVRQAPTAEALMRSRYSAYVLGDHRYLLETWHPTTRPDSIGQDDDAAPRWLGLALRRHASDGERALVEFVARYRVGGGSATRLHEISDFVREGGRWYYVDGRFPDR